MNDLKGITYSFMEWSAVVDFLTSVKMDRSKVDIHITAHHTTGWAMRIDENSKNENTKPIRTSGAALYDLSW